MNMKHGHDVSDCPDIDFGSTGCAFQFSRTMMHEPVDKCGVVFCQIMPFRQPFPLRNDKQPEIPLIPDQPYLTERNMPYQKACVFYAFIDLKHNIK
jgi:hypothetical protein